MGLCVGDALGVPVESTSRAELAKSPVTKMLGYGRWNQPPGTWSDDSSLTFCLAESLCRGYSLDAIANSFWRWYKHAYWTPRGEIFGIGESTHAVIMRLKQGISPLHAGGVSEMSNGNGSLMRILPMAFCYKNLTFEELIWRVHEVSAITHAHRRAKMACGIYTSIAVEILKGADLPTAYIQGLKNIQKIYSAEEYIREQPHFHRVFSREIVQLPETKIYSGGYVIDTLEASLWCLLNTSSYSEAVLKAVNLGGHTDTTAAVTGGLAGIYYGIECIPQQWVKQIARKQDIINLANRFAEAVDS
jgi:ADP-ribosylglycohydrolase